MRINITINGKDATPYCKLADTSISTTISGKNSTASLTLMFNVAEPGARYDMGFLYDDPSSVYGADAGAGIGVSALREVVITDADTDDVIFWRLSCVDYTSELDNFLVNGTYSGTDKAIIAAVFADSGITGFDASTFVESIGSYDSITFEDVSLKAVLDQLAEISFADWWCNGRNVHFTSGTVANAGWSIDQSEPDGVTSFAVPALTYKEDFSQRCNKVIVRGGINVVDGTQIRVQVDDLDSQASLGVLTRSFVNKDITTTVVASLYAASLVEQYKEPIRTGSFVTYRDGLKSGDVIQIKSVDYEIDQPFQIRDVKMSWVRSNNDSEFQTKYEISFGDYREDLTSKILDIGKKLEKALNPSSGVVSGSIGPGSLAPGAIDSYLAFAEALRPVFEVDALPSLPSPLYPVGSGVYLNTDGKFYKNTAGSWVESTAANVFTGKIGTVNPAKFVIENMLGMISAQYIESVYANTIVGNMVAGQSISIHASLVSGNFTAGSISVNASDVSGTFNAGAVQIDGSNLFGSVTAATNLTIHGSRIQNLTLPGSAVTDGTITDAKIGNLSVSKLTAGEANFSGTATFRNGDRRVIIENSAIQITDLTRYMRLTSGGIYIWGGEIQLGAPSGETPPFRVTSDGAIAMRAEDGAYVRKLRMNSTEGIIMEDGNGLYTQMYLGEILLGSQSFTRYLKINVNSGITIKHDTSTFTIDGTQLKMTTSGTQELVASASGIKVGSPSVYFETNSTQTKVIGTQVIINASGSSSPFALQQAGNTKMAINDSGTDTNFFTNMYFDYSKSMEHGNGSFSRVWMSNSSGFNSYVPFEIVNSGDAYKHSGSTGVTQNVTISGTTLTIKGGIIVGVS